MSNLIRENNVTWNDYNNISSKYIASISDILWQKHIDENTI
jgi:hypothetical protein